MTSAAVANSPDYHCLNSDAALAELNSSRTGLSALQARKRLHTYGPNVLRVAPAASAWKILLDQLRGVVVWLLLAAALISLLIGEHIEAAAIGVVLVINTMLGFFTELRARRAMEALTRMETLQAVVVRDGVGQVIDARELVPGDVVTIEAGQSIPADARLLDAADLRTNEAPLTGESVPVSKNLDAVAADTPLAERSNMLYKGTTVVAGSGRALLTATGMATELGRIGALVGDIHDEPTPLERRLDTLGRRLAWLALAVGLLVVVVGMLRGESLGQMLEVGIALAIAAVPEGLPAVSTIALAAGVRRMAKRNALVRRLPSVETLGSVTVICSDKTGTLTAGEMTVTVLALSDREIRVTGSGYAPEGAFYENNREVSAASDEDLRRALTIGTLANRADVSLGDSGWAAIGDPTEAALVVAARKAGLMRDDLLATQPEVGVVPFSSERMLMATFHRTRDGVLTSYVKGSPTHVLELSTRVFKDDREHALADSDRATLLERNRELAGRGLRVLALAYGRITQVESRVIDDLTFVGLAGMIDPAAPGVKETIEDLREAGIRTVMITGDQQLTAQAVARDLGMLDAQDEVLDGRAIARLSDGELAARLERTGAFSRVTPDDKLKIVAAYQSRGDVVAMFGDGVNDAAALKKADVGVAMGKRGTDVAKEAAVVVLQDDRFQTISAAVEEGRVIFDNIRKFVFYLFSCNLSEVLVLLIAGVVGLPLPLLPMQILWLNLVTDTFPALALAFEPADEGVMDRPPRDPQEAILSRRFLRSITGYAALITVATLSAFLIGLQDAETDSARALTMSFMTLALAQTFHLGNARSRASVLAPARVLANRYALGAVVLVVLLQLLAIYLPPLSRVLHTEQLVVRDWLIVLGLAIVPAVVGQALKIVQERRV